MKASELRIGNWIHHEGVGDRRVDLITMRQICAIQDGEATNILPIPLTAEWFQKLGFEILRQGTFRKVSTELDFAITICFTGTGYNLPNVITKHPIRYVHQLQNLYFALTVEELT